MSNDHTISTALQAKQLHKRYGERTVLDSVTLDIQPGERFALMGPSGSGKSTLLNCLGGIDRPDRGEVWVDGQRIDTLDGSALSHLRRETIGSVFQFFHLLPTLSAYENIEFPLKLANLPQQEREARVQELIHDVGLESRQEALPEQLSGGEMQRVAIARALSVAPKVLLADEPTGNLDSQTGHRILDLIENLADKSGTALLLVTHSQEATRICHRTLHMIDGHLR